MAVTHEAVSVSGYTVRGELAERDCKTYIVVRHEGATPTAWEVQADTVKVLSDKKLNI